VRLATPTLLQCGMVALCLGLALAAIATLRPGGILARRWCHYSAELERLLLLLHRPQRHAQLVQGQLAAAAFLALYALSQRSLLAALGLALAVVLPRRVLVFLLRRRTRRMEAQLDGWLTALSNMLSVVGSLSQAIAESAPLTTPPLREELEQVIKERRIGMSTGDSLAAWVERTGSRLLAAVVPVLLVGAATGGAYPRLVARTADALRERKRLEGVLAKNTAAARFQLCLVAIVPVAFFYIGRQLGPPLDPTKLVDYGPPGYAVLALAAALWFYGLYLAHRIMKIDI
jgi:tight adherence protein B